MLLKIPCACLGFNPVSTSNGDVLKAVEGENTLEEYLNIRSDQLEELRHQTKMSIERAHAQSQQHSINMQDILIMKLETWFGLEIMEKPSLKRNGARNTMALTSLKRLFLLKSYASY